MRNKFNYWGIKSPNRKKIVSTIKKQHPLKEISNWQSLIKKLWHLDQREFQYSSLELCINFKKQWRKEDIELFEWLVLNKSWWDTIDHLASNVFGNYFLLYPEKRFEKIDYYIKHENMWLNRIAILHQLKYKNETDTDLLTSLCLHHINHKDFFIKKAIGWALRQYAKFDPLFVTEFVDSNPFSNLTKREALKNIVTN